MVAGDLAREALDQLQEPRASRPRHTNTRPAGKMRRTMRAKSANLIRCSWPSNPLSIRYHDEEWGLPQHDDRVLFEFLILEGAQAGLSWDTVLQKRENYRAGLRRLQPAAHRPLRSP